jgi:hypothetical protein
MSINDELCDVCSHPCWSGSRECVYFAQHGLWVHIGSCEEVVTGLLKDRSKSKRGRHRSTAEIRRLLAKMRAEAAQ